MTNCQKAEKIFIISIKLRVFSDRLFVISHGGGGGGEGVHRGLVGREGVSNSGWGGATAWWGQQWGCLQPLRTTLHTKSISLQNIAGRLPENSRNRLVDRQSKKTVKKTPKKFAFSLKADLLYFDYKSV